MIHLIFRSFRLCRMDRFRDPSSQANYEDFLMQHASFNLDVDFQKRRLKTQVELTFRVVNPSVKQLILDTSHIIVTELKFRNADESWVSIPYELVPPKGYLGSALKVDLSNVSIIDNEFILSITCETTDKCEAIQWMKKEETAGKRQPYLFSQCQSNLCRSIFPCQDTPGVKFTYEANVSTPKGMLCLKTLHAVFHP